MKWFSNNIFAVNKCSSIGAKDFNHCASLCPCNNGVLLAWYSGSGECQDDQSVYITYLSHDKSTPPIRIGDKTGNPILWREADKVWMLYSKFEDIEPVTMLAHRWRYCSLWLRQIIVTDNIQLLHDIKVAEADQHLLARTNPIKVEETTILPLYDEVKRECVIFAGKNGHFHELSRYGNNTIQPAIWYDGITIHSLSRNFGTKRIRAPYFYSDDRGMTWRYSGLSGFNNVNNSIAVHKWDDEKLVLWNDVTGTFRANMTLGIVGWNHTMPWPHVVRVVGAKYGSYPCLCVDDAGLLHFAFTGPERMIEHYVWNHRTFKREFKKELKRSRNITH